MACREVRNWVTREVLVPVTTFITEARERCEEVREWVEEQVTRRVERWVSQQERRCRELPWWNPVRWFCEVVMVTVKVVEWVVETVGKWVVTLVCQIVTWIVGMLVTLVLRLIAWHVTFVVCLFTDPLAALASLRDLWMIVVDAVDDVLAFADVLLNDVLGILDDVIRLVDSIADSLGWLGVILGLVRGLLALVREAVSIVKDAVGAIRDVLVGLLSLNLCKMLRGLADLGTAAGRALLVTGFLVLSPVRVVGAAAGGVRDQVDRIRLADVITTQVDAAFGAGTPRAARAHDRIGVGAAPMGLSFTIDARRMYLDSESKTVDLRALHDAGVVDLYTYAGYASTCGRVFNEADGEVVYRGSGLTVAYADLHTYLADGPGSVPPFQVFAITRPRLRHHLEAARRKAAALGVHLLFPSLGEIAATTPRQIPLASTEDDGSEHQALLGLLGRTGVGDDLSRIPAVSHFHYILNARGRELFGLATWFKASRPDTLTGVTYRNRTPDWAFRWVLVHEIGHYLGLSHKNRAGGDRTLDEIMYSPTTGIGLGGWTIPEYALLSGEPRFTIDDARTTWEWITDDAAASLLP